MIRRTHSRASVLVERLATFLEEGAMGECPMTTFLFHGFPYQGATASTKNTEDQLRAKGFIAGQDYRWLGPYTLTIKSSILDRDTLDVIQSEGGFPGDYQEETGGNI